MKVVHRKGDNDFEVKEAKVIAGKASVKLELLSPLTLTMEALTVAPQRVLTATKRPATLH